MTGHPAAVLPLGATADAVDGPLAALFEAHEDRLYRLARRLAAIGAGSHLTAGCRP